MDYRDKVAVLCPRCGSARTIQSRGRGTSIICHSCAKRSADWCITHGESKTPLYRVWSAMKDRCTRSDGKWFSSYGGRGISVCREWLDCYESFRDWAMVHGYGAGLVLDRENNDGNYEPSNCRWVTPATSLQNTRQSKLNPQKAEWIKELVGQGFVQKDVAWAFDISTAVLWKVINGKWGGSARSTISTSK